MKRRASPLLTSNCRNGMRQRSANGDLVLEIDRLQRSLSAAETARDLADSILDTLREPLLILDENPRVLRATSAFYKTFRVLPEEPKAVLFGISDRHSGIAVVCANFWMTRCFATGGLRISRSIWISRRSDGGRCA